MPTRVVLNQAAKPSHNPRHYYVDSLFGAPGFIPMGRKDTGTSETNNNGPSSQQENPTDRAVSSSNAHPPLPKRKRRLRMGQRKNEDSLTMQQQPSNITKRSNLNRRRSVVTFQSSLLQELSVRSVQGEQPLDTTNSVEDSATGYDHTEYQDCAEQGEEAHHVRTTTPARRTDRFQKRQQQHLGQQRLSSDDIRASPRLTGYFFVATSGSVLLVSVVQ